jgi:hypothetical protein
MNTSVNNRYFAVTLLITEQILIAMKEARNVKRILLGILLNSNHLEHKVHGEIILKLIFGE